MWLVLLIAAPVSKCQAPIACINLLDRLMTLLTPSMFFWEYFAHFSMIYHVSAELFIVGVKFGGHELNRPHLLRQKIVFFLLDCQVRDVAPSRGSISGEVWNVSE
jgi:hypothetical protein